MSRVGKQPITLPAGTSATVADGVLTIKGALGSLSQRINPLVTLTIDGATMQYAPVDASAAANAMSGTFRALTANMVQGVSKGFERKLTLVGVGYKAASQGAVLNLALGFSHPVNHKLPEGIKAETPTPTEILIKGIDKQRVGQVAAEVRAYRPPEPYKGKGVRYSDERVVIKETKKK
jgi:large subunit ribosomal protein L6